MFRNIEEDDINNNDNDNYDENNILNNKNNNIEQLWLEKYRPKKLVDYLGNKDIIDDIKNWINRFKNKDRDVERFLLLHGKPGVGKTTLAHIIFNEYNYDMIEINASEHRSKKKIHEKIGVIGKYSILFEDIENKKEVGLLMEEIDGIAGGDKSSIEEMINIVVGKINKKTSSKKTSSKNTSNKKTSSKNNKKIDTKQQKKFKFPVICTCNSIKDKKLQALFKESLVIEIPKPDIKCIENLANMIIEKEKIDIDKNHLQKIIKATKSDYRSLINSLTQYKMNKNIDFISDINEHYNFVNNDCYTPLDKIAYYLNQKKSDLNDILKTVNSDENIYFLNLYNNYLYILSTNKYFTSHTDRILLNNIIDNICNADIFHKFLFENQEWGINYYISIIGVVSNIMQLNKLSSNKKKYNLTHHVDFNRMCQEDSFLKRKRSMLSNKLDLYDTSTLYYISKNINKTTALKENNLNKELEKITLKVDKYLSE